MKPGEKLYLPNNNYILHHVFPNFSSVFPKKEPCGQSGTLASVPECQYYINLP